MLMPWLPKKLQNVMAITEVLASFYQSLQKQKGHFHDTRNSGSGLAAGMALTTAFAFGLLPLLLT